MMSWRLAHRCITIAVLAALFGCATSEIRHTPADIARYQPQDFVAAIASRTGEASEYADALAKIQRAQAADATVAHITDALWAIKFTQIDENVGRQLLARVLPQVSSMNASEQRAVLSAAFALDAAGTAPLIREQLATLATPREFAIASYTILKASAADPAQQAQDRTVIRREMATRFGVTSIADLDAGEPRLLALLGVIDGVVSQSARPPLRELLDAPLVSGLPVIYSFQRIGRQQFGLALVRGADGRFHRNADGSLFSTPQLALALTGLPGTITNGNTPQGLFTIVGAGTATNKWIGPTPYLESRVPIEAKVHEFLHTDPVAIDWSHERYAALLPTSWSRYWPFQEAYLAGRAGRDEMILHGTTINTEYYRGKSYYPGTPSAGCLVAMEYWSKADGRLVQSDQLSLLKAFTAQGKDRGFLVVVEIDDKDAPVSLADIAGDVLATGR